MSTRRSFISRIGMGTVGLPILGEWNSLMSTEWDELFSHYSSSANLTQNEDYWQRIREMYTVSPNLMNLNNGGVSPQPRIVQETFEHYNRLSNDAPSYYMWRILDQGREALRDALADLAGCSANEVAINRNATEAIDTIILGLKFNKGDEIVLSKQDYPNMLNAWKWRAERDGLKLVFVDHLSTSENEEELVTRYTEKFSNKTKLVHITHMINWNGQVLPAAAISREARKRKIMSLVDGAHTFAHLNFKITDLDCDFFGTSLHKWLCAPFGSGLLYIRKEMIAQVAPIFPGEKPLSDDIRKFETLGTRSFPTELAIGRALDFHQGIGAEQKAKRLHYLKSYWTERVELFQGVKIHTPKSAMYSGAIALISIDGKSPQEIDSRLFKEFGIHTVAIDWENYHGVRITPHIYTSLKDLEKLIDAIEKLTLS
jgi:selenocysteine lyase/cysteine desulfurase